MRKTPSTLSLQWPHIWNFRRLADEDDELSEIQADPVPPLVREWLTSTFTRQPQESNISRRTSVQQPRFRYLGHAIRAGIYVDRLYRRTLRAPSMEFSPEVVSALRNVDHWDFDVFELAEVANKQPIKYIGYDLFNRYNIITRYRIAPTILENFLNRIEEGYCRNKNSYHNNIHAADVTQTVHYMLCRTGLINWMTLLEIFASLLAALIHDYDHTGTNNNFHVQTRSELALLYNDRAVQENYHIYAAFRVLKEHECNILSHLSREEHRELRNLIIEMVLATDMSFHFQYIKKMKFSLASNETNIEKSKALSWLLHCCDISNPAKRWSLHHRWTALLMEEYFQQGDKERALGLPCSPLCDRHTTMISRSQIGFIDIIVEPSMTELSNMLEHILEPLSPLSRTTSLESMTVASNSVDDSDETDESTLIHRTSKVSFRKEESDSTDSMNVADLSVHKLTPSIDSNVSRLSRVAFREETNDLEEKSSSKYGLPQSSSFMSMASFALADEHKIHINKPWVANLAANKKNWEEQEEKDAEARAIKTKGD